MESSCIQTYGSMENHFFKLIERWFYTKLWQKQNKKIENIFIAQFYTVTTHKFLCKD